MISTIIDQLNWFIDLALIALVAIAIQKKWWRKLRIGSGPIIPAPYLLGAYATGVKLEKLAEGDIKGNPYVVSVTMPYLAEIPEPHLVRRNQMQEMAAMQFSNLSKSVSHVGRTIMIMTLPHHSPVHIACLARPDSTTSQLFDRELAQYGLEPATLEGDFPDYFSLYCNKDFQQEIRQVLDPADMAFLVDFCGHNDWELMDNTLYFYARSGRQDQNKSLKPDTTPMTADAMTFVDRILPVLERMNRYASVGDKPTVAVK